MILVFLIKRLAGRHFHNMDAREPHPRTFGHQRIQTLLEIGPKARLAAGHGAPCQGSQAAHCESHHLLECSTPGCNTALSRASSQSRASNPDTIIDPNSGSPMTARTSSSQAK